MNGKPGGHARIKRRPLDEEEDSFGSLPDDELLALVSAGSFGAEESCDAVEEVLRRNLKCPDAIPLMRDLLFGFEWATLRYRAALCLARMEQWDAEVHRALCHTAAKLPVDDPMARSARLQLQKRGLSPADPPARPAVGSEVTGAAPAKAKPEHIDEPKITPAMVDRPPNPPQTATQEMESVPQSITALPRFTTEDVEEPRLHYRRRKRRRGDVTRQIFSNVIILMLFVIAFILFLLIQGRF